MLYSTLSITLESDVVFSVDSLSRQPIYEQIIQQLERFVLTGVVKPGEQLPTVRGLSIQLSINPNTIQKAYSELDRRGIICSVPGRGCFVSENAVLLLSENRRQELGTLKRLIYEFAIAGIEQQIVIETVNKAYDDYNSDSEGSAVND